MADQYPILLLSSSQVTPELKALYLPIDLAALRCLAVLAGHAAGKIF